MSIIHSALKKIKEFCNEGSKDKTGKKIAFGDDLKRFSVVRKVFYTFLHHKKTGSALKIYLVYALFICSGFLIANIFFRLLSKQVLQGKNEESIPLPKAPKELPEETPKLSMPLPAVVEDKQKPQASFILSGVFFSEDEGYALINNRIVKENDKINGAVVLEITLDEVKLELQGSVIRLTK